MSLADSDHKNTIRCAALDMGSNTLRFLLADVGKGNWTAIERGLDTPRLGRGLVAGASLSDMAKQKARIAAGNFAARARAAGAKRIVLAATQACRVASDGLAFVDQLAEELGLDSARIISGYQEAKLSRLGVLSRLKGLKEGSILADVGGASTELINLTDESAPGLSLKIGAVGLTEAIIHGDPPTAEQLDNLAKAVRKGLEPAKRIRAQLLVATAGTAATIAAMAQGHEVYKPDEINNVTVNRVLFDEHYRRLSAMPLAQRKTIKGLEPQRADIIIAGMAILGGLMDLFGLDKMITMDAGLLEGILLDDASIYYFGETRP